MVRTGCPSSSNWAVAVGCVLFDVDLGPVVHALVPNDALSPEECKAVAFHAFPDSMSIELHARTTIRDSSFFFRIKRQGKPQSFDSVNGSKADNIHVPSQPQQESQENSTGSNDGAYLYGFVFTRQRQDETLRRGGEQMSVVVLAEHPFSNVYRPLSQVAGPLYFSFGPSALEQVYQEMCSWQAPTSGPLLQLQIGLNTISCRLPAFRTLPAPSCNTAVDAGSLLSLHHRNSFSGGSRGNLLSVASDAALAASACASTPTAATACSPAGGGLGAHARVFSQLSIAEDASTPLAPSSAALHRQGSSGSLPPLDLPHLPSAGGAGGTTPPGSAHGQHYQQHRHQQHRSSSDGQQQHGGAFGSAAAAEAASTALMGSPLGSSLAGAASGATTLIAQITGTQEPGHGQPPLITQLSSSASLPSSGQLYRANSSNSLTSGSGRPPLSGGSTGGALGVARRLSSGLDVQGAAQGAFHEACIFTPLQSQLPKLWHLWELVLLGKPLLIASPSPGECSGAVAALISLIAPLPYAPDFRPYMTIHDPAFHRLNAGVLPGPSEASVPALIGITNLYFIKALPQWPNVLSVGKKEQANTWGAAAGGATGASGLTAYLNPSTAVRALRQRTQGAQALLATGHCEALWSAYRPLTRPDNTLLVRLLQPKANDIKSKTARMAFVNSEAIRKHFYDLTTALLAPFNRYFEPGPDGTVPHWDPEAFLFSVRAANPPHAQVLMDRLGSVANVVELYARFIGSANFREWFAMCRRPVQHLIAAPPAAAHPAASAASPAAQAASGGAGGGLSALQHLDEVQLINMFFSVEQQLQDALAAAGGEGGGEQQGQQQGHGQGEEEGEGAAGGRDEDAVAAVARLERELLTLFVGIKQEDLQLLCISSPQRRDLLLGIAQRMLPQAEAEAVRQLAAKLMQ